MFVGALECFKATGDGRSIGFRVEELAQTHRCPLGADDRIRTREPRDGRLIAQTRMTELEQNHRRLHVAVQGESIEDGEGANRRAGFGLPSADSKIVVRAFDRALAAGYPVVHRRAAYARVIGGELPRATDGQRVTNFLARFDGAETQATWSAAIHCQAGSRGLLDLCLRPANFGGKFFERSFRRLFALSKPIVDCPVVQSCMFGGSRQGIAEAEARDDCSSYFGCESARSSAAVATLSGGADRGGHRALVEREDGHGPLDAERTYRVLDKDEWGIFNSFVPCIALYAGTTRFIESRDEGVYQFQRRPYGAGLLRRAEQASHACGVMQSQITGDLRERGALGKALFNDVIATESQRFELLQSSGERLAVVLPEAPRQLRDLRLAGAQGLRQTRSSQARRQIFGCLERGARGVGRGRESRVDRQS